MATHLVWLRTDLRIHDNLALAAACRDPQAQVLALKSSASSTHSGMPRSASAACRLRKWLAIKAACRGAR